MLSKAQLNVMLEQNQEWIESERIREEKLLQNTRATKTILEEHIIAIGEPKNLLEAKQLEDYRKVIEFESKEITKLENSLAKKALPLVFDSIPHLNAWVDQGLLTLKRAIEINRQYYYPGIENLLKSEIQILIDKGIISIEQAITLKYIDVYELTKNKDLFDSLLNGVFDIEFIGLPALQQWVDHNIVTHEQAINISKSYRCLQKWIGQGIVNQTTADNLTLSDYIKLESAEIRARITNRTISLEKALAPSLEPITPTSYTALYAGLAELIHTDEIPIVRALSLSAKQITALNYPKTRNLLISNKLALDDLFTLNGSSRPNFIKNY